MGPRTWDLSEYIDRLSSPEERFDYWPWPGVKLLNEDPVTVHESRWLKAVGLTERTS